VFVKQVFEMFVCGFELANEFAVFGKHGHALSCLARY
jgi:elongation factor P--beta-lysine ligase